MRPGRADVRAGLHHSHGFGGGIEAFQGTTVTILESVIVRNRAVPDVSVSSVKAVCPGDVPCPASFGGAAGIDDWGTMTLGDVRRLPTTTRPATSPMEVASPSRPAPVVIAGAAVSGNSVSAVPPIGRFAAGGGIFVDSGGSLRFDGSSIDGNTSSLANSIPTPYPEQDGATDQENAEPGGVFLADGSPRRSANSTLDGNQSSSARRSDRRSARRGAVRLR